jgi:hypothetical protein
MDTQLRRGGGFTGCLTGYVGILREGQKSGLQWLGWGGQEVRGDYSRRGAGEGYPDCESYQLTGFKTL